MEVKKCDIPKEKLEYRELYPDFDLVRLPWNLETEKRIVMEQQTNPSVWVKQCMVTPFGIEIGELYYRFDGYENHLNAMVIADRKMTSLTVYDIYGRTIHFNDNLTRHFLGP